MIQNLLNARQQASPSPGGEGRDEGERHYVSQQSTRNHQLFSHGPTTRQYPAIPGNTRTLAQFLAAYCRLSVRVLPRNQFSCRIKSPSSLAQIVRDGMLLSLTLPHSALRIPHLSGPAPLSAIAASDGGSFSEGGSEFRIRLASCPAPRAMRLQIILSKIIPAQQCAKIPKSLGLSSSDPAPTSAPQA